MSGKLSKGWWVCNDDPLPQVCPHPEVQVIYSVAAYKKVVTLMEEVKTEWLAYLVGTRVDAIALVEDLYIPEQEVTASSVQVGGEALPPGCVGVMHSHVSMGAFFSGTDDAFINANHPVSVVVSHSGRGGGLEFKAVAKVQMPCGVMIHTDAQVMRREAPNGWFQGVRAKIAEKVWPKVVALERQSYMGEYLPGAVQEQWWEDGGGHTMT